MPDIDHSTEQAPSSLLKRPVQDESNPTAATAPKYKRRKHMDPRLLQLRTDLHQCCKFNDLPKAWELFQMALREKILIEAPVLCNLLSLCDGLGDRKLHVGTPRDNNSTSPKHTTMERQILSNDAVPDETRCEYAQAILSYVQDERKLPLTENAYTGLTRLYARSGKLSQAEQCLDDAERTQQCRVRLRLYTPVLLAYAKQERWTSALKVWLRLCRYRLTLTEIPYASLLAAPYFERVLADLVEDVHVPARSTVDCIRKCLHQTSRQTITAEMRCLLEQIPSPELKHPLHLPQAEFGWMESTNCTIDRSDGTLTSGCMKGTKLQAVTLEQPYVDAMLEMNERIVLTGRIEADATPFQGGGKGKKRELSEKDLEFRRRQWQNFRNYMAKTNETKKISVVIDGANVGYYEQNFQGSPSHVNYEQIDNLVRQFDPNAILLVLHVRHCRAPLLPKYAERYMDRWKDFLYQTPAGMNDDWFWLHAALETDSMVVTNDQMRDHHFQMVAPRSFLRWRDRHQIYFALRGRNIQPRYPDSYSRRIQLVNGGLVIPMPKKGDESRFLDGSFVAEDEPVEELYVCFRPKQEGE